MEHYDPNRDAIIVMLDREHEERAVKLGNFRQTEANRRLAEERWEAEYEGQLFDNHIKNQRGEFGVAIGLGLHCEGRVNTDHKRPRIDLCDDPTRGLWTRVCPPLVNDPFIKVWEKDYGFVVSNRLHTLWSTSLTSGGEDKTIVEVACYCIVAEVKKQVQLTKIGRPNAPEYYRVDWTLPIVYPIKHLRDCIRTGHYQHPRRADLLRFQIPASYREDYVGMILTHAPGGQLSFWPGPEAN